MDFEFASSRIGFLVRLCAWSETGSQVTLPQASSKQVERIVYIELHVL